MAKQRFLVFALSLVLARARAPEAVPQPRPHAKSVWKDVAEGVSERCPPGVSLLQSSAKRPGPGHADRRERAEEIGKIPEAIPFASLVESSAPSHPVVMLNQIKQVVELAQTRVQTKVGEAPYFIIAVAIGGFLLSLLSICVSLVFVERGLSKDGDVYTEPSASALLSQRLRALGLGDARSYRASTRAERSEMNPARTWEHGHQGSKKPMVMADGQRRLQIVVQQPLEGGRVGLNLAEDDLVVNNFGDLRAYDLGFRVGDRLLQVNQVPVFRESDFKFVMQDALRRNSERGEPLVFHVLRRGGAGAGEGPGPGRPGGPGGGGGNPFLGGSAPIGGSVRAQMPPPAPEENGDLRGSWRYGDARTDDLYTYEIRQVGKDLGFEQTLPNGEKITGLLIPDGLWLRSDLQSKDGYYAEIRLQYDPEEQVLVSQLKKGKGDAWSDDILARPAR